MPPSQFIDSVAFVGKVREMAAPGLGNLAQHRQFAPASRLAFEQFSVESLRNRRVEPQLSKLRDG